MNYINMFIEDFTVLDHAYIDQIEGFLGGTFFVSAEVIGRTTEEENVVLDFSIGKKQLKKAVDATMDHKLIIPKHLLVQEADGRLSVTFDSGKYIAPSTAFYQLDASNYSIENLTAALEQEIMKEMPENVEAVKIKLKYEDFNRFGDNQSFYRYTHGLKTSSSLGCKRMGHGHINHIEIEIDGVKNPTVEKHICNKLHKKHLYIQENVFNETEDKLHLRIQVEEGIFDLALDKSLTFKMPYETTVENISKYLADAIVEIKPECEVKVKAFEGFKKGATTIRKRRINYRSSII